MASKPNKAPRVAHAGMLKRDMGEDFPDQVDDYTEDDDSEFSQMVPIVCVYDGPAVRFKISNRSYVMRYGEIKEIEFNYACLRNMQAQGDPIPSAIELVTNRKVLPVASTAVPKDAEGTPMATVEARRRAQAAQQKQQSAQPTK
jgi:hypothetical protein